MKSKPKSDEEIKQLIIENPTLSERQFCKTFNIGGHRWHNLRIELINENRINGTPTAEDKNQWLWKQKYVYNKDDDKYVTFLSCLKDAVVVNGDKHRAMARAYSNWTGEPSSINVICSKFGFPRVWFEEYRRIHGWTHDKEPFTTEEMMTKDVNTLVDEALAQKRGILAQKYETAKWKDTKDEAEKYRQLKFNVYDPLNAALQEWKPEQAFKLPKTTDSDEVFSLVINANDWHIGLKAIESNMTFGGTWNTQIGIDTIKNYLTQIYADVQKLKVNWKGCYLFNGGDIPHGLRGLSEYGTPQITDTTKQEQWDAVFDLQTYFIEGLYKIFGYVEELGVCGNHEGFDWYPIARALQERYKNQSDKIKISASTKMVVHKKIGRVLFILTHGKNPFGYKFKYGIKDDANRQVQIQQEIVKIIKDLASTNPEEVKSIFQIAFIQGENHFFKAVEKGMYLDLQLGSPLAGDLYADANRLNSRPSQSTLLISHQTGIKSIWNYYFDSIKRDK